MIREFECSHGIVRYVDIAAAARKASRDIDTLPYVMRVLLENLCRHQQWGNTVTDAEIGALLGTASRVALDLPLHVARVILPDSSGLPVLQDLAALRDAVALAGGDPVAVDTRVQVDLIVDHSLQVDNWGDNGAVIRNLAREYERNAERYSFLKWAQQAFRGLRVFPPGTGIIHQVNLEHIAQVVTTVERHDGCWAFPDFVIGGDSHTPMVNALGVLGWGVGGIDAEAALLGEAYTFPLPEVVGVRLVGTLTPPALTTDAALLITQRLRMAGVTNCMVEFFGPGVESLSVPERATIANMAPEYGATCGFFPVDGQTLRYLRSTARDVTQIELVESYCRANHLYRETDAQTSTPIYDRVVEIDLSSARPAVAGPQRPQDRMELGRVPADFHERLSAPLSQGGFGIADVPRRADNDGLRHGSVVLAAITSCTNTSNPAVMMAAGLVARKAVEYGLRVPPWVKTSLAPGSRAVTHYLSQAGLLAPLETLGFNVIGYGCSTCGGKSGPLLPEVANAIEERGLVTAAVLSGNRNFEGRIHKLIRANYIGAPPLVLLYALAGRIDIDFDVDPIAHDDANRPVFARDLWPHPEEIDQLLPLANNPDLFANTYGKRDNAAADSSDPWQALQAPTGILFPWRRDSTYLIEPPFFRNVPAGDSVKQLADALVDAQVLVAVGDSLTTDHISPGGEIPVDTPAGEYLLAAGVTQRDFNTYVARRCNHEVMTRATFANVRMKNALVPEMEGGITRHFPDGETMTIFAAARTYREAGRGTIVLAGKEYGTGSSRDWAAKGSALLGIRAVLAESFERIHRANLVGMGVLPLRFEPGEGWRQLGLTGAERFSFANVVEGVRDGTPIQVTARGDGKIICFRVHAQVLTEAERKLISAGGIPASVLRSFTANRADTHPLHQP